MTIRSIATPLAAAVILAAALTGCTSTGDDQSAAIKGSGSVDPARFVACLQSKGLEAKIVNDGSVSVRVGDTDEKPKPPEGGVDNGWISYSQDQDGLWQASERAEGFAESTGLRGPYAECQQEVPGFAQPARQQGGPQGGPKGGEVLAANLDFAACARENGLTDFEDPQQPTGALVFPATLTEDQFRAVLEVCGDTIRDVGFVTTMAMEDLPFDWKSVLADVIPEARIQVSAPR